MARASIGPCRSPLPKDGSRLSLFLKGEHNVPGFFETSLEKSGLEYAILAVARDDRLHKRLERESLLVWLVPDG